MRLIHADDEVIELRQYISERCAQCFLKLMEVELRVSLAVEDFSNIEDEKLNFRGLLDTERHLLKLHGIGIVIFAVIHLRSAHFRFKPFEDVLRMIRIGLLAQLIINCISGCKNEEVLIALRFVQMVDASTHQTSFSDAGGHSKAK